MSRSSTTETRSFPVRNPRRAAWEFLQDVERDGSYVNLVLGSLLDRLDSRDRPFVTELVYGSVRMRRTMDDAIDQVIDRHIDPEVRALLRLACYEGLLMNSSDHAVVNEYVELAKSVLGRSRAGFVNAVMRRVVRERDHLLTRERSIGVETSHPDWIVQVYSRLLPEEELLNELNSHNTTPPIHAVSFAPLDLNVAEKSPRTTFGYRLKSIPRNLREINDGRSFIQDEGSQVVCEVALATDPDRALRWLDLCAGPGGKFSFLAHFLKPGFLEGVELHSHRAQLVTRRNPGYNVHIGDGRDVGDSLGMFDRILLDAPCSGLGALRRRPDARWRKQEGDLKELISIQRELLDTAAEMLKPSGLVIYVTCSPHPFETSAQVRDFLHRHGDFFISRIPTQSIPSAFRASLREDGTLQLMTGRDGTDAMFLALLQRGPT